MVVGRYVVVWQVLGGSVAGDRRSCVVFHRAIPPQWPCDKAFVSRAVDPGFDSRLRQVQSHQ